MFRFTVGVCGVCVSDCELNHSAFFPGSCSPWGGFTVLKTSTIREQTNGIYPINREQTCHRLSYTASELFRFIT